MVDGRGAPEPPWSILVPWPQPPRLKPPTARFDRADVREARGSRGSGRRPLILQLDRNENGAAGEERAAPSGHRDRLFNALADMLAHLPRSPASPAAMAARTWPRVNARLGRLPSRRLAGLRGGRAPCCGHVGDERVPLVGPVAHHFVGVSHGA